MLMFLTTADLLMKISHVHSFSELQCLIYFHHFEGDDLKIKTEQKYFLGKKLFDGSRTFYFESLSLKM